MSTKVEAQGGELVIRNAHGDVVIIPRNKRREALGYLAKGDHSAIDAIAMELPKASDYAMSGGVYDGGEDPVENPVEGVMGPETTIVGKRPFSVKNFLTRWGKHNAENPSDNFFGALGQGLMAPLQLAQAGATYALTGGKEIEPGAALRGSKFTNFMNKLSNTPTMDPISKTAASVLGSETGQNILLDPLNIPITKGAQTFSKIKPLGKEKGLNKIDNILQESNQLPELPHEIILDQPSNYIETINLRRNSRTNNLPPAPFVTNSEFPQPIDNLMDALNLSDSEFTRLRNTYKNDPNYFKNNRIFASESALNNFITAENPRMFENNFLNINNNTSISDLINNRALTERLDFDLNKYKNLTFNELVIKNPTLAEKLKLSLSKLKENTIKFTKDLDLHAGTIINPKQSVDRIKLESSINDLLNQGLGIKKTDIPIQVKSEGNKLKIYIDQEKNGKFLESGYINIPEEGLNQKTLTETLLSTFKKEHKGVQKTLDFPTNNIGSSSLFNSNINTTGIGGELGEAIKQGLKQQNKSWNLLSSTSHTNEGALRYLTEYLNNRKLAIDISGNPEWLKIAEETKKLYPNGIKKAEVEKLLKNNPDLRPSNIKFAYSLIPIILGTNYIQSQNQNKTKQ